MEMCKVCFPAASSSDNAEQRLPTQKMLIMTHWLCSVDIFKFLTEKDKADLRSDYNDKIKCKKLKFDYYPDVKLDGIESSFNIFELQGLIVSLLNTRTGCMCKYA